MSQPVDAKQFYGYLFEADKKPTKVLDALLRGIAIYISTSIGNKEQSKLTPEKLATFYKAVGGNYDSLFVEVPHPSISWIYASIGCQHTLQPTTDDFSPPSIPALTKRGFVRWQSIEILLGPEEHVPFIQNAVRTFGIKNPDTGEPFPIDLPTEAFPLVPDKEIEKWHNKCAEKLRQRATPTEEDSRPHLPPRPKVQSGYTHVRPPRRADTDYFEPKSRGTSRPIPYQHVSSTGRPARPKLSRSPSHRAKQFLAPEDTSPRLARPRRRSVPENLGSSPGASPSSPQGPGPDLRPPEEQHPRRHSHPRHARRGSFSSDASSSSDGESPPSPASRSRRRSRQDIPPSVRYAVPPSPSVQAVPPLLDPRLRPRERERDANREREEELKRRSFPIPIDLSGKLSAPFLLGKRSSPRSTSRNGNVRWKDLDGADLFRRSEDDDPGRRRGSREERSDREGYKRRERERDAVGVGVGVRPKLHARRSSHEDLRRDRERDRERGGDSGDSNSRRFREREQERGRRVAAEVRGVDGRRYPAH